VTAPAGAIERAEPGPDHGGCAAGRSALAASRASVGKYGQIARVQLAFSLAYPLDLAARSLTILIFLWVFVHLWRATYAASGHSQIAGLTLPATLWYLVLAETIALSKPRLAPAIARSVRDGTIAVLLCRPYHYLLYELSSGLADSVLRLGFSVTAGAALVWATAGPPPAARHWPLVLVAVLLGWLIDFCIASIIGLSAFVVEDTSAFEWLYSKALLILGGVLLPLDFFPRAWQRASMAMPFAYTVYGPARLFVAGGTARALGLFAAQLAWIAGLGVLLAIVYRWGTRRLAINGG
jgi:ABC-2 type transport system permease protein